MQDETAFKLLKILQDTPQLSQRDMASQLGVSLGKANATIRNLLERGLVTLQQSAKRVPGMPYVYTLTPMGIQELINMATDLLEAKTRKINELKKEIAEIEAVRASMRK